MVLHKCHRESRFRRSASHLQTTSPATRHQKIQNNTIQNMNVWCCISAITRRVLEGRRRICKRRRRTRLHATRTRFLKTHQKIQKNTIQNMNVWCCISAIMRRVLEGPNHICKRRRNTRSPATRPRFLKTHQKIQKNSIQNMNV